MKAHNNFLQTFLGKSKAMIKLIVSVFCMLHVGMLFSQNVGINSTGANPNTSALLDVEATDKGILIPRVSLNSTTDVTTIATPATNLLVFNTNAGMTNGNGTGFYYYDGASWIYMVAPTNGPGTSGEVLTSQGGGTAPQWASTGGDCLATEITNELDASGNPCSGTACGLDKNLRTCTIECSNLNYNGNSDWRIGSSHELVFLLPFAPGNTSNQPVNSGDGHRVRFADGDVSSSGSYRCRCVR